MLEWLDIWPIFNVCAREAGYKGGGKLRVPWWRQAAAEKQLRFTVEDILVAAREQRQQESGRHGEVWEGIEGKFTDINR